ncbi:MAG: gamma-glutamyl-gamma-aminobutyrate hydrolase family protein [Candidatus Omnitrophica bacterium]|nr:gamma-glutamyl-gamma-aminobutyrate hydrolase family protein [Candidatus Omnitrophota bacterium]
MKKLTGYILILVFISISFISCNKVEIQTNYEKNRIVLVQPYLGNLKSIIYFVENKYIEIPNLELTAVIYAKAKNDYDNIKKFLSKNDYSYISLMKIDGDLNENNLFQKNPCTDDFHTLFNNSDGLLFFGGNDLPPSIYGQKTKLTTSIKNPYRHYFHLSFLFHLLGGYQNNGSEPFLEENPNYIINGFCLGM